jgi:TonB family protein
MNELFVYLLETSVCLGFTLLIYRFVLSELTFFAWNRAILLLLLVLSFSIPLLSLDYFGISGQAVVREITLPVFQVGEQIATQQSSIEGYLQVLLVIYLCGVILTAARLILGFMLSRRLIGQARLMLYQGHLIAIHERFVPASFFEYILMPDFQEESPEHRQIILHEAVHVKMRHSWDLILVNLAKVIFWFNPLIYLFEKSLREVHEFQADSGVTRTFSPKEYATLLLQLISPRPGWQFMNNFSQFQTKKRILMMAKTKSKPLQKARFLALIPAVLLLVFAFACEITPEQAIEGPTQVAKAKPFGPSDLAMRITQGADEVFDVTEVQPVPPGGMEGWVSYLGKNLKYPLEARKMGIEGVVIVSFVINADGSIREGEILRGIGAGADEEALRVVMESPNWTPAYQRGRAVASRLRLPVRFTLGDSELTVVEIPDGQPNTVSEVQIVAKN